MDGLLEISIDVDLNEFSDDTLCYVLYNSDKEEISTGFLNGEDNVIIAKNVLLEGRAIEEYLLIVWLLENNKEQNTEMQKNFVATIQLDASQKKD